MKTLVTTVFIGIFLLGNSTFSQEKNIKTDSVEIENFISYIVEHYKKNDTSLHNLTFLVQTGTEGFSLEDKVILKQAFTLLSKRLPKENTISLLGYSGLNGVALNLVSVKETKEILNTLENFKSSIKELNEDGITLAYNHINENFNKDAINRVVIVRLPNTKNELATNQSAQKGKKKKNNTVVLTAITLLPEIISVLKD